MGVKENRKKIQRSIERLPNGVPNERALKELKQIRKTVDKTIIQTTTKRMGFQPPQTETTN